MNLENIKSIHFVGIGGIGMSGIAEILAERGLRVSGCDLKRSAATDLLQSRGIAVSTGHHPAHLDGVDAVVVTAAVRGANAEIEAARARGIAVIPRKEMLGALAGEKRTVGVSGTHGKTTTTAMIALVLEEAGLDPTILIGGMLRNIASNAKSGRGEFLVVEADEYDRTFHELHPEVAVVTNIEADHLEYFGDFDAVAEAFRIFVDGLRPGGLVVGCVDDPAVAALLDSVAAGFSRSNGGPAEAGPYTRVLRYGLSPAAELTARNLAFHDRGSSFEVEGLGFFKLFVPGEHNVRNALAAIGVARALGVGGHVIAAALSKFLGVDRRFQILGDFGGALVVDDYAHHPTEIRATLDAARSGYPQRRIVALFQPHLYSRTRDFAREFGESLGRADVAMVAPIFAARETPIEGISARMIAEAGEGIEFLDRSNDEIVRELRQRLEPNDVFIVMGAGDVHEIAEALVREGAA
jgi:UDP-N-acetylmuramate--alanine ligase